MQTDNSSQAYRSPWMTEELEILRTAVCKFVLDYPIAQMYADARVQKIYGGANEIMKEIIARSL